MAIFSWYDCKLKNVNPAVPTKMVLMSIKVVFFLFRFFALTALVLLFIHYANLHFHFFKRRNILAIFKMLWCFFFSFTWQKMALRYNTTLSHRVWKHHFGSAPALVLITQGRLPMRLHLQPLPAIVLFIAPRTPWNYQTPKYCSWAVWSPRALVLLVCFLM